jgi:hypothetical protein
MPDNKIAPLTPPGTLEANAERERNLDALRSETFARTAFLGPRMPPRRRKAFKQATDHLFNPDRQERLF